MTPTNKMLANTRLTSTLILRSLRTATHPRVLPDLRSAR